MLSFGVCVTVPFGVPCTAGHCAIWGPVHSWALQRLHDEHVPEVATALPNRCAAFQHTAHLSRAPPRTHIYSNNFLLPAAADVPERRELSVNEAASARAFLLRLVGALTQLGAPSSLVEHLGQKAARGMMLRMDGEIKPPLIQSVSLSYSSYTGGPPSIHLT
jgi:hypothetical protein